jgi:hypothetical protein
MDGQDNNYDGKIANALVLEDIDDQNTQSPSKISHKKDEFPQTNFTNA